VKQGSSLTIIKRRRGVPYLSGLSFQIGKFNMLAIAMTAMLIHFLMYALPANRSDHSTDM
jgi:hypothetical protein